MESDNEDIWGEKPSGIFLRPPRSNKPIAPPPPARVPSQITVPLSPAIYKLLSAAAKRRTVRVAMSFEAGGRTLSAQELAGKIIVGVLTRFHVDHAIAGDTDFHDIIDGAESYEEQRNAMKSGESSKGVKQSEAPPA
jgi:hypothetical protein